MIYLKKTPNLYAVFFAHCRGACVSGLSVQPSKTVAQDSCSTNMNDILAIGFVLHKWVVYFLML
jgi:hypothetical protein